ncbi:MAG: hypothetical protein ACJAYG_002712 [Oceanicoccus sp.]|jgi:hypothetical protein
MQNKFSVIQKIDCEEQHETIRFIFFPDVDNITGRRFPLQYSYLDAWFGGVADVTSFDPSELAQAYAIGEL